MLKYCFFTVILLFCSISFAFGDFSSLIAKADTLLEKNYEQPAKMQEALRLYQKILQNDPGKYNLLWKIGKTYYFLGNTGKTEDLRKEFFQNCIDFSKKAIGVDESKVDAHYFLGICYGKFAQETGIMTSISLINDIKKEMNIVNTISPSYSNGGAYRTLGRISHKLPWFMGGNNKKSIMFLKKAVELGSEDPLNYLFLAETYLASNEDNKAYNALKSVLKYTSNIKGLNKDERETRKRAEVLLSDCYEAKNRTKKSC